MPRTTIDIDAAVLRELTERKRREGKSLGTLVSELLAEALDAGRRPARRLEWAAQPMRSRIDLDDKEAVRRAIDG